LICNADLLGSEFGRLDSPLFLGGRPAVGAAQHYGVRPSPFNMPFFVLSYAAVRDYLSGS
jgi:hypothetical protein